MNPELQDKLTEIFPWFDVYVECGDGWQWIISDMLREIDDLYFDTGREVDIEILQVKEKWAELRVYHDSWDEAVNNVVDKYCKLSNDICEICGGNGNEVNYNGWILNRCEECEVKA